MLRLSSPTRHPPHTRLDCLRYTVYPEDSYVTFYKNCSDPFVHPTSALECLFSGRFSALELRTLIAGACCNTLLSPPVKGGNERCCKLLDDEISDKLDVLEVLLDHVVVDDLLPGPLDFDLTSYARCVKETNMCGW